jgi:hypothetical protein
VPLFAVTSLNRISDWNFDLAARDCFKSMTREELEEMLRPETFTPFVLTVVDGTPLVVDELRNTLLGQTVLVIAGKDKKLYHVPFGSIAHFSERGEKIG